LLLHAWFTAIQFENSAQLAEKHKDINRSGKTFGKNGKTNTVIDITHLKTLNCGARI
jgi:hypothetical protein